MTKLLKQLKNIRFGLKDKAGQMLKISMPAILSGIKTVIT